MLWLALGPFPAMENQVLVIRIKIPNSGAVDWTVHSGPQLLFRDVLDVIGQVLPEATTTAFELLFHSNGTASKWTVNRASADISKSLQASWGTEHTWPEGEYSGRTLSTQQPSSLRFTSKQ